MYDLEDSLGRFEFNLFGDLIIEWCLIELTKYVCRYPSLGVPANERIIIITREFIHKYIRVSEN